MQNQLLKWFTRTLANWHIALLLWLYFYLIRIHLDHTQGLCLDSSQCREVSQNMHRTFCIRRHLWFPCAAHTVEGRTGLEPRRQFPQFVVFSVHLSYVVNILVSWSFQHIVGWSYNFLRSSIMPVSFFQLLAGCGKGSRPVNLVLLHSFTNLHLFVVCHERRVCPVWRRWSCNWSCLSVQIICSFTSLFSMGFNTTLVYVPVPSTRTSAFSLSLAYTYMPFFSLGFIDLAFAVLVRPSSSLVQYLLY